jgi:hypothetical protein
VRPVQSGHVNLYLLIGGTDARLITDVGGSAVLLRVQRLAGEPELTIAFSAARDLAYGDIITSCDAAADALEAMAAACNFRDEQLWDKQAGLGPLAGATTPSATGTCSARGRPGRQQCLLTGA